MTKEEIVRAWQKLSLNSTYGQFNGFDVKPQPYEFTLSIVNEVAVLCLAGDRAKSLAAEFGIDQNIATIPSDHRLIPTLLLSFDASEYKYNHI